MRGFFKAMWNSEIDEGGARMAVGFFVAWGSSKLAEVNNSFIHSLALVLVVAGVLTLVWGISAWISSFTAEAKKE